MAKLEIIPCPDEADLVMRALERAREVERQDPQPRASAENWPSCPDVVVALAESYLTATSQPATAANASGVQEGGMNKGWTWDRMRTCPCGRDEAGSHLPS
jgi:hypothetical protein